MTRLTQRQAWLKMAHAYAMVKPNQRHYVHTLTWSGCCAAISYLERTGAIRYRIANIMNNKIRQCLIGGGYFNPYPRVNYESFVLRADFCYLMAYACEDE